MTFRTADLQDAANRVIVNIKDYIHPAADRAYATGVSTSKQLRRVYPAFAESVQEAAQQRIEQSRRALKAAGAQLAHAADEAGHKAHGVEKSLLKISIVYLAYRLFVTDDHIVRASRTVKAHIHEKPVESAFMAFGVGYVLAKILR